MVVIGYGNSYSKITGLNLEQMAGLRKVLSYKVSFAQAKWIPNPANRLKYCIDLKGNFASGLLTKVQRFLQKHDIEYWIDSSKVPKQDPKSIVRDFKLNVHIVPYSAQIDAVERLAGYHRGVCSMPTGCGKSHVITMLLHKMKLRTLIVVPTLELKYQLTKTLSEAFISMEGITVENIDSTALNKATDYDCLIIDECHRSGAKTYRDLNKKAWTNIRWRYCFSATPWRNDKEEQLLYEGVAGEVIYELTYKEAVAKSYIVPVEAYFYELPKEPVKGNTYAEVYSETIVNNKSRNELIADLLKNLWAEGKHTLVLVKEVKHGMILHDLTGIPFSHGGDDDSRQWIETFKSGRLKCLIATTGLMGEGIDSRPAEFVIIAGLGRARSALMQQIGRTVRKYPGKESGKVIIFRDKSHKFLLTSFRDHARVILEEYGVPVVKLER